jgi:hypothetical protein
MVSSLKKLKVTILQLIGAQVTEDGKKMPDFDEMKRSMANATDIDVDWRKRCMEAEKRLTELQQTYWDLKDEFFSIKYEISRIANRKYPTPDNDR